MKNYLVYIISGIAYCLAPLFLLGQEDSILLTRGLQFQDGIYLTYEDFKQNKPVYTWNEVKTSLFANTQHLTVRVEYIRLEDGALLTIDDIWGLCLEGTPYIHLKEQKKTDNIYIFAGLRVKGKICYFSYWEEVTELVTIKAYNPLNGRPFRSAEVPREKEVLREKIFLFEEGRIVDFSRENFLQWIQEDVQLWNTVMDLSPVELEEKLFRCLLIFVDRNDVYLKS